MFRSRPTAPNPFGDIEPPTEGELADVIARGRRDRDLGLAPVIEQRTPGCGWSAFHPVVTLAQLQAIHLAREHEAGTYSSKRAKVVKQRHWTIEPEGQRAIREAASADPLDFRLESYAVKR